LIERLPAVGRIDVLRVRLRYPLGLFGPLLSRTGVVGSTWIVHAHLMAAGYPQHHARRRDIWLSGQDPYRLSA
jgi:hypothetical protein